MNTRFRGSSRGKWTHLLEDPDNKQQSARRGVSATKCKDKSRSPHCHQRTEGSSDEEIPCPPPLRDRISSTLSTSTSSRPPYQRRREDNEEEIPCPPPLCERLGIGRDSIASSSSIRPQFGGRGILSTKRSTSISPGSPLAFLIAERQATTTAPVSVGSSVSILLSSSQNEDTESDGSDSEFNPVDNEFVDEYAKLNSDDSLDSGDDNEEENDEPCSLASIRRLENGAHVHYPDSHGWE